MISRQGQPFAHPTSCRDVGQGENAQKEGQHTEKDGPFNGIPVPVPINVVRSDRARISGVAGGVRIQCFGIPAVVSSEERVGVRIEMGWHFGYIFLRLVLDDWGDLNGNSGSVC